MMELSYETTKTSMTLMQFSEEMKDLKDKMRKDTSTIWGQPLICSLYIAYRICNSAPQWECDN